VPVLQEQPAAQVTLAAGTRLNLAVRAEGTGPLSYQWLRDGVEVAGATTPSYEVPQASVATAGHYRVLVRGLVGTVLSGGTAVTVTP